MLAAHLITTLVALATTIHALLNVLVGSQIEIAIRSERDLTLPLPINNITAYGVNLNTQVFDIEGYSTDALGTIYTMFDLGIQVYLLDLYWNEYTGKWQLCPAPIPYNQTYDLEATVPLTWNGKLVSCQPGLTMSNLLATLHVFIMQTNTVLDSNVLQFLINLKSIEYKRVNLTAGAMYNYPLSSPYLNLGNSSLSDSLTPLGQYLFLPTDLDQYAQSQQGDKYNNQFNATARFPSVQTFLISQAKRMFYNVVLNSLVNSTKTYNVSDNDSSMIFFPKEVTNSVLEASSELHSICHNEINGTATSLTSGPADFRFIIDSNANPFDNSSLKDYMRCGYSPIITSNTTLNTQPENVTLIGKISEFIPIASWAWGLNQPTTNLSAANLTLVANLPPLQANLSAPAINWLNNSTYGYNCVALYEDGFRVDNCYNEYPFACLKINSTTTWQTTKDKKAYFESVNEDSCPSGYSFAVPRLADNVLELIRAMLSASLEYPIWVDLNDITVTNCFVSGGPYAQCPYKQTVSRSKIVKMIAPSFSVAAFIIILVLLEKFLRINPIQTNRKTYWKRVINEYNEKHDYEGVPS